MLGGSPREIALTTAHKINIFTVTINKIDQNPNARSKGTLRGPLQLLSAKLNASQYKKRT